MGYIVNIIILLVMTCAAVAAVNACPVEWIQGNDSCYKLMLIPQSFDNAASSCERDNAYLASVEDSEEHNLLADIMRDQRTTDSWIGLRKITPNTCSRLSCLRKNWILHDDTFASYVSWGHAEPGISDMCASLHTETGSSHAIGRNCNDSYTYICERAIRTTAATSTTTTTPSRTTPSTTTTPVTTPLTKTPSTTTTYESTTETSSVTTSTGASTIQHGRPEHGRAAEQEQKSAQTGSGPAQPVIIVLCVLAGVLIAAAVLTVILYRKRVFPCQREKKWNIREISRTERADI